MKIKNIFTTCAAALLLSMTACEDQLDIIPKGKTTLETVSDLELLLNQEWAIGISPVSDISIICNESLGMALSIPGELSQTNTLNYAYYTFNDQLDRALLTNEDSRYTSTYKYINYMNVLIEKLPGALGDESRKSALIAEARIIRAYLHWLLVNIYAQQYDAATAANMGGIPYVTDTDVSLQKTKLTLEETYQCILNDCTDEVINQLSDNNLTNPLRPCKAFGKAVRAKVLMQMKRYEEALPYALAALQINGKIEDRSVIMNTYAWELPYDAPSNYLYIRGILRGAPFTQVIPTETIALFEPGDYVLNYDLFGQGWDEMYAEMLSGISGTRMYFNMSANVNEYGISSDHMYYVAAECYIRTGEIRKGLEMVDAVRAYRVENYQPFVELYDAAPLSEQEAMALLQPAKWIECIATYENFFDCKRWNSEEKYKRSITRDLGDYGTYTISPESPLWVLPFPANAVRYNSSLTQNY